MFAKCFFVTNLQSLQQFKKFVLLTVVGCIQNFSKLRFIIGHLLGHTIDNEWVWLFCVFNIEDSFGLFTFQLFNSSGSSNVPTQDNKDRHNQNDLIELNLPEIEFHFIIW